MNFNPGCLALNLPSEWHCSNMPFIPFASHFHAFVPDKDLEPRGKDNKTRHIVPLIHHRERPTWKSAVSYLILHTTAFLRRIESHLCKSFHKVILESDPSWAQGGPGTGAEWTQREPSTGAEWSVLGKVASRCRVHRGVSGWRAEWVFTGRLGE